MEEKKLNFDEKIIKVQEELKAPKGQYNSFGKYNYRSCEDILEAVKPILRNYNLLLTLSDDLVFLGDRYYIKARAEIVDAETLESRINTAYAREEEEKKGMDGSQITGTASSYARKYALNGLFLIDDTKDADTDEYKKQIDNGEEKKKYATKKQIEILEEIYEDEERKAKLLEAYNINSFDELDIKIASALISKNKGA